MDELPNGTVTLLFTDIEGSTLLVAALGDDYESALSDHRQILRTIVAAHDGHEVDCRGGEFLGCFTRAADALSAAIAAQRALAAGVPDMRVRMGLHTGEPALVGGAYVGIDVNRAARICSAAHGGQILISASTRDQLEPDVEVRDLGSYRLAAVEQPERIYEVLSPELGGGFPPIRAPQQRAAARLRRRDRTARSPLAEAAWRARELIETGPLKQPLTELAAAFFDADRSVNRTDAMLARIDTKRLARRLRDEHALAVRSPIGEERALATAGKVASLDRLVEDRQVVIDTGAEAGELLGERPTSQLVSQAAERLRLAVSTLDAQLEITGRAHDASSYRLRRTRWRGVYRLGDRYAVVYYDEVGVEHQREFTDAADARRFRKGVKEAEDADHDPRNDAWRIGP